MSRAKILNFQNLLLLTLIISIGFLRFYNLGYSDYISDEPGTFLYRGLPEKFNSTPIQFLLDQRKGPIQIFIGFIPYFFLGNYQNELAQRIPFASFNLGAVIIFYFALKRLTKNTTLAFISAFLLGVNGFVSAFGRVAQYQSLNMFFSFAALYFYSFLLDETRNLTKKTLFGTFMYCLSILSHWDAIYILPMIVFIFIKYLLRKDIEDKAKTKLIIINFVLGCIILLPFLIPYILNYFRSSRNQDYLDSRVGIREDSSSERDLFRFRLYNPFVALEFYLIFAVLGLVVDIYKFIKKNGSTTHGAFALWFLTTFIIFKFFIHHSGTHIYNLTIPALALASIGTAQIVKLFPSKLKLIPVLAATALISFLYYQTYIIFVDHEKEYPWEQERILGYKTRGYSHEDNIRNLIGFPLFRDWKAINEFVEEQNEINGENFGYTSNEDKGLTGFYMEADHRDHGGFYAIGIKRPLSFATDYTFPQIKGKQTVKKMEINGGQKVRIYRVEETEND